MVARFEAAASTALNSSICAGVVRAAPAGRPTAATKSP